MTKAFGDADRTAILSFRSCHNLDPPADHTLVMHAELEGRVYTELKQRNHVVIPSRDQMMGPPKPQQESETQNMYKLLTDVMLKLNALERKLAAASSQADPSRTRAMIDDEMVTKRETKQRIKISHRKA